MTEQETMQGLRACWEYKDCSKCPFVLELNDCHSELAHEAYKTIERLQSENAALRERLEKAVELPCKIGDEVYEVHGKCDRKNCPYNGYYGQWRCDYGGKSNCNPFITVNKFCYCDIPMVGKTIFVTKKAAEARLAELKGGAK